MSEKPEPKGYSKEFPRRFSQKYQNRTFFYVRVLDNILDVEKHLAWHNDVELDQLIFRNVSEGVQVLFKGVRRGKPVVAWVNGKNFIHALELAGEDAFIGRLVWKPDKWPSKRVKAL